MTRKLSDWPQHAHAMLLSAGPPADCALCGEHMEDTETQYEREGLCGACAERAANLFWHARSGQYLTWENPASPKPKKRRIPNSLRWKVYERDRFRCVYCKSPHALSLDHVKAEALGGETTVHNLVTACRSCNTRKRTQSLAEFMTNRGDE